MRTRICFYILLLMPLVVYFQAIFSEYGFRDDYGNLRQAREDTAAMVKTAASHGRPLFGALAESTYAATGQVERLVWMRLTSLLLLTILGVVLWRQLYQSGWTEVPAAAVGLGVSLLPSAQIVVGVASYWPQALTLLLSMAGFSAIETEIERGGLKRLIALLGGCMIYTAAGLIYQPNMLFTLVPIMGVYLVRTGREPLSDVKWLGFHLATLLSGLLLSYLIVQALYANGVFEAAVGSQSDDGIIAMVVMFFAHPLPNALALFALADDQFHGAIFYFASLAAVVFLLVQAYRRYQRLEQEVPLRRWRVCLGVLPVLAFLITFVLTDGSRGYRHIFTLAVLVLMFVIFAIQLLLQNRKIKAYYLYSGYVVAFVGLAILATSQSLSLIAEPQIHEWKMMRGEALRANLNKPLRVFVITTIAAERPTERSYGDEFGVLTSEWDAGAQELFKAAVRARFPDKLPPGSRYTVESGRAEPAPGAYDLVIDMRKVKELRGF